MHRFIGAAGVQSLGIGIGIDRHSGHAHFARSAHNAAGDLSAIGDEEFLDHARPITRFAQLRQA